MTWRIVVTPTAQRMLSDIQDRRVQEKIIAVINRLAEDPEKQGKALLGELSELRSIRAAGQRYRVIYAVKEKEVVVIVVAVGIRRDDAKSDVYSLAKKLFRLKLIEK